MAPKFSKTVKSSKKFEDLNDYCLLEVIQKLSLKEKFKLRLNSMFKQVVERSLILVNGLRIGRNHNNCEDPRHTSISLGIGSQQNNDLFEFTEENKRVLKLVFKFCPNIKCIELSAELDLKTMVWITKQCKRLECLQVNNCVISSRMTSRHWIQIGDQLADRLIHLSINCIGNPEKLSEFGLIYLIQNLTLLEEFSFDINEHSIAKISTYFSPNLKTLKLNKCYKTEVNPNIFNTFRLNTKVLENLEVEAYDYYTLDLICQHFPRLKSLSIFFFLSWDNMDSLPHLSALTDLQHLKIEFYQNRGVINYLSKTLFPNLRSLNLTGIAFTPEMFRDFDTYLPNIERLVLYNCSLLCEEMSEDYRNRQDCNNCKENVWKYLSKLKHFKQLSVNLLPRKDSGFSKSFVWTFNELSFPEIEELDFRWLPYDCKTFNDNLLEPLIKVAVNHPKRWLKLKVNSDFFGFVSKKRQINGIKYNVLLPNIPRNLKILNTYP